MLTIDRLHYGTPEPGICSHTLTVLVDGEQETEPEWIWLAKYRETNNTSNPCLDVFSFFQANFILVPFPTHRQQVPSFNVFRSEIMAYSDPQLDLDWSNVKIWVQLELWCENFHSIMQANLSGFRPRSMWICHCGWSFVVFRNCCPEVPLYLSESEFCLWSLSRLNVNIRLDSL